MNRQVWLICRREYSKIIRSRTFWLTTFLLPVVVAVFGFISGLSSENAENSAAAQVQNAKEIAVLDEGDVIAPALYKSPYVKVTDLNAALQQVKAGQIDALFVYPKNLARSGMVDVYAQATTVFSSGSYNDAARDLYRQSVLARLNDPRAVALLNGSLDVHTTSYRGGAPAPALASYLLPGALVALYFLLLYVSLGYMITGVSEEKENRVIEIMLTTVRPYRLVWGKLLGLMGVVFTQLVLLLGLALVSTTLLGRQLPFELNLAALPVNVPQLLFGVFYLLAGLFLSAALQLGLGAMMPSAREAGRFSGLFLFASISPVYFVSTLLQNPNGVVAQVTSYFPLTAPLILLLRNALGALPLWEAVLGALVLGLYVALALELAFVLFHLGSLEYTQRVPFKQLFAGRQRAAALPEQPRQPVK